MDSERLDAIRTLRKRESLYRLGLVGARWNPDTDSHTLKTLERSLELAGYYLTPDDRLTAIRNVAGTRNRV